MQIIRLDNRLFLQNLLAIRGFRRGFRRAPFDPAVPPNFGIFADTQPFIDVLNEPLARVFNMSTLEGRD